MENFSLNFSNYQKGTIMQGRHVNPLLINKGDTIATSFLGIGDRITIVKSHKVKRVEMCPIAPEKVHIDQECHDSRFSTVVRSV